MDLDYFVPQWFIQNESHNTKQTNNGGQMVAIILELYAEDWCFHYVGEFVKPENNSYLIISIHPHHVPLETSTCEPAQAIAWIFD